jgi:sec-independent protein translocase protein TatA
MGHIVLFLSGGELMVIVFFALLFFGADAIPGLARTAAKAMREFRKATDDIKQEFETHTSDIKNDFNKLSENIETGSTDIKRKIEEELND